jgi:MFS family permease
VAVEVDAGTAVKPALGANFALLWGGQFVSQMGDRLAMVAFPWLIYGSTKSAFGTGIALALYTLPYVLFGTIAGVAIDRFNKRWVMIISDLTRALLVLAVPFAATHSLPLVYGLGFLIASIGVFFEPCKLAVLPDLVPNQLLMRANSLLSMAETFTEVVGYAVGGFVAYSFSTRMTFGIDALTFAASAAALLVMRYAPPPKHVGSVIAVGLRGEIREGVAFIRGNRPMLVNTVLVLFAAAGLGACSPLSFLFAVRVIGGGVRTFGFFEAAIGAGFLCGSLVMAALSAQVRIGPATTFGLATMGIALVTVALVHSMTVALVPFFIAGTANAVAMISIDTFFQQTIPEHLRGRVWGVRFTLTQTVLALSVLAGAAAAGLFSLRLLFVVAGAIIALPGLAGLLLPRLRSS